MRILVIGSGGREHALVWKLKQSSKVTALYCAPGNSGIGQMAECISDLSATDIEGLLAFAEEKEIDLTVVGPEASLLAGVVDAFTSRGLEIFGPNQAAAKVEGSKRFAKELMEKYQIPTGTYRAFTEAKEALAYVQEQGVPIVVKADGLAAGKGVTVAHTLLEAEQAIREIMDERAFGEAGAQIVIEEYLMGQEISLMAFLDGETLRPMVIAQDHKPVFSGDQGPNTGGMGAYSPVPQIADSLVDEAINTILIPMAKGLKAEGINYLGVIYAGLMMTEEGPKVIEFNARFGDPETQVVLPRLENDLVDVLMATVHGELHSTQLSWRKEAAICVIQASKGYPGSYEKGAVITGLEESKSSDSILFHSGTIYRNGKWLTAGGRVLGITALGADLTRAREKVYQQANNIQFDGVHYRKDIGAKAAEAVEKG